VLSFSIEGMCGRTFYMHFATAGIEGALQFSAISDRNYSGHPSMVVLKGEAHGNCTIAKRHSWIPSLDQVVTSAPHWIDNPLVVGSSPTRKPIPYLSIIWSYCFW